LKSSVSGDLQRLKLVRACKPRIYKDLPAAYPRFDLETLARNWSAMFILDQQGGPTQCIPKPGLANNNKNHLYFQKVLDNIYDFRYFIIVSVDLNTINDAEAMMNFTKLKSWVDSQISVKKRLNVVCIWYLIFLMMSARKHSITAAAKFSGLQTSQFSRFLKNHPDTAVYQLDQLSKKQASQFSPAINALSDGQLPWHVAIIIDSTIQHRSSLHSENVKRFNHGKGFQIGHQWTNIVLLINDKLIPLVPIPFYTKNYCRKHRIKYKTENALVVDYIEHLNLFEYIGDHDPNQVVVLADSGYDDRKIENAILKKNWHFIIALKKTAALKPKTVT
jgi:hypothetical protein